ncbi:MAG: hypothetical protein CL891_04980 [Dehalococcoidia bacterium]|nr:hypothetical protein [Dehalococcoidia bacterium]
MGGLLPIPTETSLDLNEAYSLYIDGLKQGQTRELYQDLRRFVQWCGTTTKIASLTPQTVASYAEWIGRRGGDPAKKLAPVKALLVYLKRKELIELSLAPHIRIPKGKGKRSSGTASGIEPVYLTQDGFNQLTSELELLKIERIKIVDDIGRAMEDKDFRENAPLDAAKERQGFVESKIRELESILNVAVVGEKGGKGQVRITMGKKVRLKDASNGKLRSYLIVHPREASPSEGKLSSESPVGKALINKKQGEEVEISAPKGTIHYLIERVYG